MAPAGPNPALVDCCVALGADLRRGRLAAPGSPHAGLWRDWLATSSVVRRPAAFLAVRIVLALFMVSVCLGSALLMAWAKGKWCIYLTHWSIFTVASYLSLAAYGTAVAQRAAPPTPKLPDAPPSSQTVEHPPWWLPVLWSLHAVALPTSCLVFLLFWLLVYPGNHAAGEQPITFFVHGLNFAVMVLDATITRAPYQFVYLWTAWLVYAIIYVLFTIIYFLAGGTNEYGMPWIYAVLDWGANAQSAGILAGLIVALVVPILGLLAYWLVFNRRKHLDRETLIWAPPACAGPPLGPAQVVLNRLRSISPRLTRFLPLLCVGIMGATIVASTILMTTRKDASYWRYRRAMGAVVPYVSDTATNTPGYQVFACGLTVSAARLASTSRALYEGMDPLLHEADIAVGIYVYESDSSCCASGDAPGQHNAVDDAMTAPSQTIAHTDANGDSDHDIQRDAQPVCCCSTGRWRHCCCCCCSQSLRVQGRSAYICALVACAGLPLLGWCSENKQLIVHLVGAGATFIGVTAHWCLLTRIQSVRCSLPVPLARGDAAVTRARAALLWGTIIVAVVAVGVACIALGRRAQSAINNFIFALVEYCYVGILGIYGLSLCHEMGVLANVPNVSDDSAKVSGAGQP